MKIPAHFMGRHTFFYFERFWNCAGELFRLSAYLLHVPASRRISFPNEIISRAYKRRNDSTEFGAHTHFECEINDDINTKQAHQLSSQWAATSLSSSLGCLIKDVYVVPRRFSCHRDCDGLYQGGRNLHKAGGRQKRRVAMIKDFCFKPNIVRHTSI